jgi:hypothetical protein
VIWNLASRTLERYFSSSLTSSFSLKFLFLLKQNPDSWTSGIRASGKVVFVDYSSHDLSDEHATKMACDEYLQLTAKTLENILPFCKNDALAKKCFSNRVVPLFQMFIDLVADGETRAEFIANKVDWLFDQLILNVLSFEGEEDFMGFLDAVEGKVFTRLKEELLTRYTKWFDLQTACVVPVPGARCLFIFYARLLIFLHF